MEPRKVAYVTPLYFDDTSCIGGGERYPLNVAMGVAAGSRGEFAVDLISFGPNPGRRPISPGVDLVILRPSNRPANPLDVVSWDLPAALADADLVHIHSAYCRTAEVGLLVAKQRRLPVCITDHGGYSSGLGNGVGFLELADRIISNSDFGGSLYKTTTPVIVVKGGVDTTHFTPPPIGSPRDRLLYVGRLLPHKGIDTLIAATPPDLKLTVCGRPYHAGYFELLQRLAIGKDVEFVTGADDDAILALYRRAWVNVLPSVYQDCYGGTHIAPELMGFTLQEAMACGAPAICSRVGAMPEYVDHGVNGFVFDTPAELTGQLRELAGNPRLVAKMGRAARRVAEREYDKDVVGAKVAAIYRGLLAKSEEVAA